MINKTGCLIIHGFAGNLKEIELLENYLSQKGYITLCPKLPGHTENKKDLLKADYKQWINTVKEAYEQLSQKCDLIVLIGFSMGGLLNIQCLTELANGKISNAKMEKTLLITLNTPIFHWDFKIIVANLLHDIKSKKFENFRFYLEVSFRIPILALLQFKSLLINTKPLLKNITCPIFVVQGMLDDTVQKRSAYYIYNKVNSNIKQIKFYENSVHQICRGLDKEILFEDIYKFIQTHTEEGL